MRLARTTGLLAAACLLTACAQGTGDSEETSDASFDSDADLSGTVQVMGFGAGDEIATVRLDRAKEELGDATVKLIEGDLDIQQFLSSVASGEPPSLVYAERGQIAPSPREAPSCPSPTASRVRASTPLSSGSRRSPR